MLLNIHQLLSSLRFTPNQEVALCGHATLASAHALYESKRETNPLQTLTFKTIHSGNLTATGKEDGTIELNFPSTQPVDHEFTSDEMSRFVKALNIDIIDVLYVGKTPYDLFIQLSSLAFAKLTTINYSLLAEFGGRGVIITCLGGKRNCLGGAELSQEGDGVKGDSPVLNPEYDVVSRFFAPW